MPKVAGVEGSKQVFKKVLLVGVIALWLLSFPLAGSALAQTADKNLINTGDTAFMLISAALVLLMTPGLAFFYGGLVRSRNVLNTMMMSLILIALVGVTWVLWGYSLAFAPIALNPGADPAYTDNPLIGGLNWLFLNNVAFDAPDPVGY